MATFQAEFNPPSKDELEAAFGMMDKNGDGYLTKDELKAGLASCGQPMSDESIDDMIAAADTDKDKRVSYQGQSLVCVLN